MKIQKRKFYFLIVLSVFIFCSILHFSGAMQWSENKFYDSRIKRTAKFFKPSDSIVVVLLDQESLNWAQQELGWGWPWPRESYARMIDFFNSCNANSVAFDMVFSEPSVYGPQDDAVFADAASKFGRVIQTVFYKSYEQDEEPVLPVDELKNSAGIIGTIQSNLDSDGVARRNRLYSDSSLKEPSLAIASLLVSDTLKDISEIPVAKNGGMYIRYQNDLYRYVPYSAKDILQAQMALERGQECNFDLNTFEDSYVFFGLDTPGLFDICATPVSPNFQGVGVHICQLDTILNGYYLRDVPVLLVLLLILLCAAFGALMGEYSIHGKFSSLFAHIGILILGLLVFLFLSYALFIKGIILPVTSPLISIIVAFVACLFKNYRTEGKQRRYLKHAFSQYLSPAVIDRLIENPEMLKLGGEKREISVYFSDIQNFTSIAEKLTPEELTEFLNTYLSAMTDIILAHGGTIDKYEGDAIIAFWNAPTYQGNHAKLALETAMECQEKLAQMRNSLAKKCGTQLYQRIGLNTGDAVVGNMGSSKRFNYTILGDAVNLASRLEGVNKQFGTYTICSKTIMQKAIEYGCDYAFRELGNIAVVGKKEGVNIFEPMLQNEFNARKSDFENFAKGLSQFSKGNFKKAKSIFEKKAATDMAAAKYVEKCEMYIQNPPQNWDGVIRATEK